MSNANSDNKLSITQNANFRGQILAWYDQHRRSLPWRDVNDPYKTWLSEVMLQQTTVQAVKAYYEKFLKLWPTVQDLSSATQEEVLHHWAGLGYYSRARNLHKCAQIITNDHKGQFPSDQNELKKLPGIGDYSSAAIRTIAFNKPATVVDGNIERIITRIFCIKDPLPKSKPIIKQATAPFFETETKRPGDFAQALMDIGATICTPKSPKCTLCPISTHCMASKQSTQETFPVKTKKKKRPLKRGYVYWVENKKGQILLQRRPEKGMLAGTLGFPTSEWIEKSKPSHLTTRHKDLKSTVTHTFTHFDLELKLFKTTQETLAINNGQWLNPHAKDLEGLPSVFSKVYKNFLLAV